jgi:hypothetical protein
VYICRNTILYICTHIHTYIHTYIYIHTHTHIHTYIHTYIPTYIHHTYLPTYIHTYIHRSTFVSFILVMPLPKSGFDSISDFRNINRHEHDLLALFECQHHKHWPDVISRYASNASLLWDTATYKHTLSITGAVFFTRSKMLINNWRQWR